MQEISIAANKRDSSGKGVARKLRAAGRVPAIYYGATQEPIAIDLEAKSFHDTLRKLESENVVVNLDIQGDIRKALLREVQRDPIDDSVLHADFYGIAADQEININVPVHLMGTAAGILEGGILQTIMREIEISCLANKIPSSIEVDVSEMQVGDSIHVRDIAVEGFEILAAPQRTIATLVPPTVAKVDAVEEEDEEVEAEETADGEPEVLTEKKKEDE